MKGLLLKDFYTLFKQMKILLLIIVVFTVMPGPSFSAFAIMYSAMLPITALAYDERSKWSLLASMMPYSKKDIVLSKFLLGYIAVGAATVLSLAAKYVLSLMGRAPLASDDNFSIVAMTLISTVILSINMPIMFRFGVEKGRLVFIIIIVLIVSGITAVKSLGALNELINIDGIYYVIAAAAAVILNIISILVSVKIQKN